MLIHDKVTAKAYDLYARMAAGKNFRSAIIRAKQRYLHIEDITPNYVDSEKQMEVLARYRLEVPKKIRVQHYEQTDRWNFKLA